MGNSNEDSGLESNGNAVVILCVDGTMHKTSGLVTNGSAVILKRHHASHMAKHAQHESQTTW